MLNIRRFLTEQCPHCEGSGKALDWKAVGQYVRGLREKRGISLRSHATAMGLSAAYVSDLELGRRGWSTELFAHYNTALGSKREP